MAGHSELPTRDPLPQDARDHHHGAASLLTLLQESGHAPGGWWPIRGVGVGKWPPRNNPELALILAGVPDALAQMGGDLYAVILNVAVNAWMAGHIHGEDAWGGCDGSRGLNGHDWEARMRTVTQMQPDITKWFDRDVWTSALNSAGFTLTRP